MAQHTLHWIADHQLQLDKAFVMLGFLLGLPLGTGIVGDALAQWGAPDSAVVAGLVVTVAATTVAAMRLGKWLTRRSSAA